MSAHSATARCASAIAACAYGSQAASALAIATRPTHPRAIALSLSAANVKIADRRRTVAGECFGISLCAAGQCKWIEIPYDGFGAIDWTKPRHGTRDAD